MSFWLIFRSKIFFICIACAKAEIITTTSGIYHDLKVFYLKVQITKISKTFNDVLTIQDLPRSSIDDERCKGNFYPIMESCPIERNKIYSLKSQTHPIWLAYPESLAKDKLNCTSDKCLNIFWAFDDVNH